MKSKDEGTPDVTKCGTGFRFRRREKNEPAVGTEAELQYLRDRNADLERREAARQEQDRMLAEFIAKSRPMLAANAPGTNGNGNGHGGEA